MRSDWGWHPSGSDTRVKSIKVTVMSKKIRWKETGVTPQNWQTVMTKKIKRSPVFSPKIWATPSVAAPGDTHPSDANVPELQIHTLVNNNGVYVLLAAWRWFDDVFSATPVQHARSGQRRLEIGLVCQEVRCRLVVQQVLRVQPQRPLLPRRRVQRWQSRHRMDLVERLRILVQVDGDDAEASLLEKLLRLIEAQSGRARGVDCPRVWTLTV